MEDEIHLSMKDNGYMFKKRGRVRQHLTVAVVICLLSVLNVSSA